MERSLLEEKHPWTQPWWKADDYATLIYFFIIHILSAIGLVYSFLYTPNWKVFVGFLVATAAGGLGTTVGYHRALSHRAVKLHPVIEQILIFFAVFNGS